MQTCQSLDQLKVEVQEDGRILNEHDLAKLTGSAPELSVICLLSLFRRQLQIERDLINFNWLELYKACISLSTELYSIVRQNNWQTVHSEADNRGATAQAGVVAIAVAQTFKQGPSSKRAKMIVEVLGEHINTFLAKKGNAGLTGCKKSDCLPLQMLRPSHLEKLKSIAAKVGLMDELFTAEQRSGIEGLQETIQTEDVVRAVYENRRGSVTAQARSRRDKVDREVAELLAKLSTDEATHRVTAAPL